MKYQVFLLLVLLTFGLGSCKKENKVIIMNPGKNNKSQFKLVNDTTIKLPISNSDYFSWYSSVLETSNGEYLFRENGLLNEIQIYDLENHNEPIKQVFKTEGLNGIRDGVGLSIIPLSLEKYYITNKHHEMYLIKKDSILKRFDLSNSQENPYMMPTNHAKTIVLQDSIFGFGQYKQIHINTNEYLQSSIFALFDIHENKFTDASITFPESYLDKCWTPQMLFPAYTYNEKTDKIIFSFPAEKNLYSYDYHLDEVQEITVPFTEYFGEIDSFKECEEVPQKIDEYFLNTPNYINIIYDKYRDKYYRMFFLPPDNISKGMRGSHTHKRLGIIIYDKNFKVIHEELFKPYTYFASDYFVNEDGLWLSMNNPESQNFDENYFQFALLNLR